jgi:NADH-quinone oxidoreductase subunit J
MFWILGPLAVVSSLAMLLVKKAVHSAILMAFVMVILAIFYIAQDAAFLGIVQVVVYTGAVMMLFLFILMLVGVDSSDSLTETIRGLRPIAITAAIGFGGLMVSLLGRATIGRDAIGLSAANADGNVQGIAVLLFSTYVFAFEAVSALLITAFVNNSFWLTLLALSASSSSLVIREESLYSAPLESGARLEVSED